MTPRLLPERVGFYFTTRVEAPASRGAPLSPRNFEPACAWCAAGEFGNRASPPAEADQ